MSFESVDGYATSGGTPLPDGGVVILADDATGAVAVRLRRNASRDETFGSAGIARLATAGAGFRAHHVMRLADGRLLISGSRPEGSPFGPRRLVIVRLLANGAVDASFGAGGIVPTGLLAPVFASSPVALGPDGSIVLIGDLPRAAGPDFITPTDWVVAKLSADGVPDPTFGVVKIPLGAEQGSKARGVAVTPAGSIVTLGAVPLSLSADSVHLVGLTALGTPDPGFNGGAPVTVPLVRASQLHRRANGALDVFGGEGIVRFDAAGALDTAYGSAGRFAIAPRGDGSPGLVALPDGGWLLVRAPVDFHALPLDSRLTVQRITAGGAAAGSTALRTPFGGGHSSPASGRTARSRRTPSAASCCGATTDRSSRSAA